MRITNQMITNKMLLNISRNANNVNNLYTQMTTGKKIQLGSENPIIASRALKFRTNVSETNQYLSNVAQGMSWMEITEASMANITETLMSIKERANEGSDGLKALENKKTFATQLESYLEQLRDEMNATYAGRYIYSGYRTDTPPIFTKDNNEWFEITQTLSPSDVEHLKVYTKDNFSDNPELVEVDRLKLPYTNVEFSSLSGNDLLKVYDKTGTQITGSPFTIKTFSSATTTNGAYNPPANEAYYIEDTGEIILGKDVADVINQNADGSIGVTYEKAGFADGDLNPVIYFECEDKTGKKYNMDGQNLQFEFGVNTRVTVNNLAKNNLTASLYSDLRALIQQVNGIEYTPDNVLRAKYAQPGVPEDEVVRLMDEQRQDEKQKYEAVLHEAFSNMLGLVEKHASQASKEYTQLGSRMNRLELISNRLTDDRVSFTALMSQNENVDYEEAIMNFNSANYVYQMALQVGGSMMQMSLADFIR